MTDEELEALLQELEAAFREDVQAALALTADEFAEAVMAATEITAAPFSVSRIRDMWNRRVGGLMTRLRSIARRGADVAAEAVDEPLPDGWTENLDGYVTATEELLRGEVADTLVSEAQRVLAENEGASLEELKAVLLDTFSVTGPDLGPAKAAQIATTEATRAFNAGNFAAAEALTGPERPIVKQWITRNDDRVRRTHREANGQLQLLSDPFQVGTSEMQYPGDPTAPADEVINCRCVMRTQAAADAAQEGTASMAPGDSVYKFQSNMPLPLKNYWLRGEGAAKIRWGTPGAFDRCVRNLRDDFPQNPEGLCANLYHEATGRWPGQRRRGAEGHTGAMVALLPSDEDAQRLALNDGEIAEQLHVTLAYLGDGDAWTEEQRHQVVERVRESVRGFGPVHAKVFGAAQWNPTSDEPAWVWNVGDESGAESGTTLLDVVNEARYALYDFEIPEQHSPWVAHMCAKYGADADMVALAERVGPVTLDRMVVAFGGEWFVFDLDPEAIPELPEAVAEDVTFPMLATWSTPGAAALAFENQQTGDGRVFAPGALYWDGDGPWPLMASDTFAGHDDAGLAGAIHTMSRDGDRITGDGVLYLNQTSGVKAADLLSRGAPLGVSVDLDDVDLQAIDATGETFGASLVRASLMPLPGGGYLLEGETLPAITAASDGTSSVSESSRMLFTVGPGGTVPSSAFEITAAAGDSGEGGSIVSEQNSGDYLMRITRARVRGATLVNIPAFADARIVLDDSGLFASGQPDTVTAAAAATDYDRVVRYVRKSILPVAAYDAARFLKLPVNTVRRYLSRAAQRGKLVKLTRGLYVATQEPAATDRVAASATTSSFGDTLTAAATGAVDLPVAPRDTEWNGDDAATRVFEWADGDPDLIGMAFAYRDDDANPLAKGSYKLGYADVVDGVLTIIPRGVSAAQSAMSGARGGVDLPSGERTAVQNQLNVVSAYVDEVLDEDERDDMEASAWSALKDLPAMPAAWFREPTEEELPPGGPGVNYANGRIFGWVAQADEPHAGFAKKIVVNDLGDLDMTHFLRQRFTLDDGSVIKAGAFTMNAGHHRDGAECETANCQFDDTRTVAGIVTVGMSERGLWFSGAAAPWMSEWDRQVFMATQPSYHLKKGSNGKWQLRAVLSVPVPGHSSPLLASAVVERSQMALTAAATMAEVEEAVTAENERQVAGQAASPALSDIVAAVVAALDERDARKARETAELEELLNMGRTMAVDTTGTEGT